ncbi:MAG: carbohydrate binding family 9 domain-containing protein [Chlorobi bacterium]|nr:carbohydrate binding family 9 domain-containing protein [Chlorobiota bacterium]
MLRKPITLILLLLSLQILAIAQQPAKKELTIVRTIFPPKIDGLLDDETWKNIVPATDFIQVNPYNGNPASFNSEVKIVYDDNAIYVGAMMYDPYPDSILTELSERDDIGMTDYFGIYFDCFNDYLTSYGFYVTASGVQIDIKSTEANGEDNSWDAVWKSEVRIVENGWIAELKIPYSALRFPKQEKQVWGLQIYRVINRYRENSSWNFINREEDGINNQAGVMKGIENIKPPLRLSFVPYVSGYLQKSPETKKWGYSYNYGLDVKYGLNESFTLDMTLIPDFGQVQSDDEIYNLSPFEVYYDERRPFFQEGTELFDKGDVFYTRRIGAKPSGYYDVYDSVSEGESIVENPLNSQLINATKISGKTRKKLGVGIFNAVTSNTWAEAQNDISGEKRKILAEAWTNYNMLVLDQALKNNSFVSFYNTNVLTPDNSYSANVTGTEFKLANKSNMYAVRGQGILSQKYNKGSKPELGYTYTANFGKISGNFQFELEHEVISNTYDPNDMGFLRRNNSVQESVNFRYNIYKPFGIFLDMFNNVWFSYESLYAPNEYTSFDFGYSVRGRFKNFLTAWMGTRVSPVDAYDYFEPRVDGRYFLVPPSYNVRLGLSPDYRKRFLVDLRGSISVSPRYDQKGYSISMGPRYRVNDKLMFVFNLGYYFRGNDIGYVDDTLNAVNEDVIIFGKRKIDTWENILEANYKFTNKSSLAFRLRHYWITVQYNDYFDLMEDGTLNPSNYSELNDISFNSFNIDMFYTWNFAPGSELIVAWKNSINTFKETAIVDGILQDIETDYFSNLNNTLSSPATNSFSIKFLYYLDYQYLKGKRR